jgi:hypothetical protein
METQQNATLYEPTKLEEILLDILLNPENRLKSVTDICKLAKCDRVTYYRAMKKPEFVAYYQAEAKNLTKHAVGPIINTFIREAQRGSFQHGKVLLEMADVYTEKVESVNYNQNDDVTGKTPVERQARIEELLKKRDG